MIPGKETNFLVDFLFIWTLFAIATTMVMPHLSGAVFNDDGFLNIPHVLNTIQKMLFIQIINNLEKIR